MVLLIPKDSKYKIIMKAATGDKLLVWSSSTCMKYASLHRKMYLLNVGINQTGSLFEKKSSLPGRKPLYYTILFLHDRQEQKQLAMTITFFQYNNLHKKSFAQCRTQYVYMYICRHFLTLLQNKQDCFFTLESVSYSTCVKHHQKGQKTLFLACFQTWFLFEAAEIH